MVVKKNGQMKYVEIGGLPELTERLRNTENLILTYCIIMSVRTSHCKHQVDQTK